jgi:hypothetical protein
VRIRRAREKRIDDDASRERKADLEFGHRRASKRARDRAKDARSVVTRLRVVNFMRPRSRRFRRLPCAIVAV